MSEILPYVRERITQFKSIIEDRKSTTIYIYVNEEVGLKILKEYRIKFTCPKEFNDPFDCNPNLIDYKLKNAKDLKRILDQTNLTRNEKRKLAKEKFNKSAKSIEEKMKENFLNVLNDVRISCFSLNKNNVLMWSHYANKHKGFCIGINVEVLLKVWMIAQKIVPLPVNYSDKIVKYNYYREDNIKAILHAISFKSASWKYEEEIRLFTYKQQIDFVTLPDFSIEEINIGLKNSFSVEELSKITSSKKFSENLKIFKSEMKSNEFDIEFHETNI